MVIAQKDGFIFVILSDGEFLPERFDRPTVAVFRQGDSTGRQLLALKKPGESTPSELLAPSATPLCNYSEGGPLHQHTDGSWWYYDETWAFENGPFETQELGADSLQEYCETVLAERKPDEVKDEAMDIPASAGDWAVLTGVRILVERMEVGVKTRTKILIVIVAALLYFIAEQRLAPKTSDYTPHQSDLELAYKDFNQMYFRDRLPHDVVIDFAESSVMASTVKMSDGRFHIAFNERYNQSIRQARETELHEMCHIATWRALSEMTSEEILTNQHGRRWRSCMLQLDMQGAFRREIIDYYEEN